MVETEDYFNRYGEKKSWLSCRCNLNLKFHKFKFIRKKISMHIWRLLARKNDFDLQSRWFSSSLPRQKWINRAKAPALIFDQLSRFDRMKPIKCNHSTKWASCRLTEPSTKVPKYFAEKSHHLQNSFSEH